jgi:hypothetical protein
MSEDNRPGTGPSPEHDEGNAGASQREQAQTDLILRSVRGVAAFPDDWRNDPGGVQYFYRRGSILVRDWHRDRVTESLRGLGNLSVEARESGAGATRLTWAAPEQDEQGPSVEEVLGLIEGDPDLGPGVAAPDHLLYVCVHSCAAVEPEPVAADADPVPRRQLGQDAADPRSRHGRDVDVLVMDTGLVEDAEAAHAWLAGVEGEPDNAIGQAGLIRQDGGHGTFTAGCVRVTAPESTVFVADATSSLPIEPEEDPLGAAFESELAREVRSRLVAGPGKEPIRVPDILVLNFAGTTRNGGPPLAFAALYDDVIQHLKELLILSPAGNEGDSRKNWPGSFSWVVSVGALAASWRRRASWSNHGPSVDVFAPGEDLVNAYATGTYDYTWEPHAGEQAEFHGMARWSGTSFSTPLVAGMVASRMSDTGQSSRRAWQSLLDLAEGQALPGLGPVLYPGQGER